MSLPRCRAETDTLAHVPFPSFPPPPSLLLPSLCSSRRLRLFLSAWILAQLYQFSIDFRYIEDDPELLSKVCRARERADSHAPLTFLAVQLTLFHFSRIAIAAPFALVTFFRSVDRGRLSNMNRWYAAMLTFVCITYVIEFPCMRGQSELSGVPIYRSIVVILWIPFIVDVPWLLASAVVSAVIAVYFVVMATPQCNVGWDPFVQNVFIVVPTLIQGVFTGFFMDLTARKVFLLKHVLHASEQLVHARVVSPSRCRTVTHRFPFADQGGGTCPGPGVLLPHVPLARPRARVQRLYVLPRPPRPLPAQHSLSRHLRRQRHARFLLAAVQRLPFRSPRPLRLLHPHRPLCRCLVQGPACTSARPRAARRRPPANRLPPQSPWFRKNFRGILLLHDFLYGIAYLTMAGIIRRDPTSDENALHAFYLVSFVRNILQTCTTGYGTSPCVSPQSRPSF